MRTFTSLRFLTPLIRKAFLGTRLTGVTKSLQLKRVDSAVTGGFIMAPSPRIHSRYVSAAPAYAFQLYTSNMTATLQNYPYNTYEICVKYWYQIISTHLCHIHTHTSRTCRAPTSAGAKPSLSCSIVTHRRDRYVIAATKTRHGCTASDSIEDSPADFVDLETPVLSRWSRPSELAWLFSSWVP